MRAVLAGMVVAAAVCGLGGPGEIPAKLAHIPQPDGATLEKVEVIGGVSAAVFEVESSDAEGVLDYYWDWLYGQGWQVKQTSEITGSENGVGLLATKDNEQVLVTVAPHDGKLTVSMTHSPAQ